MFTTLLSSTAFILMAANIATSPPNTIHEAIIDKTNHAQHKVVVAVSERGKVAADTASELNKHTYTDKQYSPILHVLSLQAGNNDLAMLSLNQVDLPAFIFYDKSGHEIKRLTRAIDENGNSQGLNAAFK